MIEILKIIVPWIIPVGIIVGLSWFGWLVNKKIAKLEGPR